MLPDRALKRGRRACAHDLAFLAARVAESMRYRALEVIRVARVEEPRLSAHGQLDLALDDHAALSARVPQHLLAGVGIWRIALVQNRHVAFGEPAAHEPQFDR